MTSEGSAHPLAGLQGVPLRLGAGVKRAEQALMARKGKALRGVGLTVPQYAVLLHLVEKPGMSGAQLARATAVTPQTMTTVLGNLEAKGLIGREVSEAHSKVLVTRLTPAGEVLVRRADELAVQVEAELWDAFEPDERERFRAYLERAVAVMEMTGNSQTAHTDIEKN